MLKSEYSQCLLFPNSDTMLQVTSNVMLQFEWELRLALNQRNPWAIVTYKAPWSAFCPGIVTGPILWGQTESAISSSIPSISWGLEVPVSRDTERWQLPLSVLHRPHVSKQNFRIWSQNRSKSMVGSSGRTLSLFSGQSMVGGCLALALLPSVIDHKAGYAS